MFSGDKWYSWIHCCVREAPPIPLEEDNATVKQKSMRVGKVTMNRAKQKKVPDEGEIDAQELRTKLESLRQLQKVGKDCPPMVCQDSYMRRMEADRRARRDSEDLARMLPVHTVQFTNTFGDWVNDKEKWWETAKSRGSSTHRKSSRRVSFFEERENEADDDAVIKVEV